MKMLSLYIFNASWVILKASLTLDSLFRKITGCIVEDVFLERDKFMDNENCLTTISYIIQSIYGLQIVLKRKKV